MKGKNETSLSQVLSWRDEHCRDRGTRVCVCVGSGGDFRRRSIFLPRFINNNNNNIYNNNKFKELGLFSMSPSESPISASCWNEVGNDKSLPFAEPAV